MLSLSSADDSWSDPALSPSTSIMACTAITRWEEQTLKAGHTHTNAPRLARDA